jgi:CelD/BcsL family acetyltransferase involved in cellulose biosynthesis
MATADSGRGAQLGAGGETSRAAASGDTPFVTEIFDGADEALAALEAIESDLVSTGFQTLDWLTVLYEELALARRALPRLVVVTDREREDVALALPLVVAKEGSLRTARFADLGVGHYGAPMLGRRSPLDSDRIRLVWRSMRAALRDVDLIRLERMPAEIAGRPNPLLHLFGSAESAASGHRLVVPGRFEQYLQSLGNKYRRDHERCRRRWQAMAAPRLFHATSDDDIAHVFATMEEQQAVWHAARGTKDVLAEPASRLFYERLAIDGGDAGLTEIHALAAGGRILAIAFGLLHDGTFTLLRVSTAGEQWSHLSPGRLVVLETVRRLIERGVHRFDFGVNSNTLKHGFGTELVPLYDLVAAQDLAGLPKALAHELFVHRRAGERLKSALKKALPRLGT